MGINQFTALTDAEFYQIYLTPMPEINAPVDNTVSNVGAEIDWVAAGKVSRVKNQGQCGSCWAFSTTGVCESWSAVTKGTLPDLSEQQLVDCSRSYGNQGCSGGWPYWALSYIRDKGITTQAAYPYVGVNQPCKTDGGDFKISGYINATGCAGIESALAGRPISIAVDGSNWSPYRSGIFSNCGAGINHAVLLVGLSSAGGFWNVKNSWGTSWGENGFIRLKYGNTCGMCNYPGPYPS
jgi:C1A family cysteine protease